MAITLQNSFILLISNSPSALTEQYTAIPKSFSKTKKTKNTPLAKRLKNLEKKGGNKIMSVTLSSLLNVYLLAYMKDRIRYM